MKDLRYDIAVRDGHRTIVELRGFSLPPGKITFLFGESGIGKSLTAKALFGLLNPDELSVTVNRMSYARYVSTGEAERFRKGGFFVFQEPSTHLNPLMTLSDQLTEGTLAGSPPLDPSLTALWQSPSAGELERMLEVFPKPHRPSGGEKQRVLCAMAFRKMDLTETTRGLDDVFVFDEPTGSLDNRHRDLFLDLLCERYRKQPSSILVITHDYSIISMLAGRHRDLMQQMIFREMALDGKTLLIRDFSPETYTGWLAQRQTYPTSKSVAGDRRSSLRIESGIEVFGRRLIFSRDPEGAMESPLEVPSGGMVYLKAASGAGKTTVAKLAMGLLRARRFKATLDGITLSETTPRSIWRRKIWGRRMTMVFQHADEALNLRGTVRETLLGLPVRLPEEEIVREVRNFFGTAAAEFLDRKVGTLSGGQKQRLNLLRSLVLRTDVLILDEPLNGLDLATMRLVLDLIEQRMSQGVAILLISHNEEIFDACIPPERIVYLTSHPSPISTPNSPARER